MQNKNKTARLAGHPLGTERERPQPIATEEEEYRVQHGLPPPPIGRCRAAAASRFPFPAAYRHTGEQASQEDKVIGAGSGVAAPAQPRRGQDVGRAPRGADAEALQPVVLTLALHEGEDGVLLLGGGQGLG